MDIPDSFPEAVRDYRFLLDRGYPRKASLKITGDRYRLSAAARTMLFRGVLSAESSLLTREKLLSQPPPGSLLLVDGYNVLLTVMNYRLGRMLFRSTDGLVRDTGGLFGSILHRDTRLDEAANRLIGTLARFSPAETVMFLDAPVSHSREHARHLLDCDHLGIKLSIRLVRNSDIPLQEADKGIVCTSDSVIAQRCRLPVWDAAFSVIEGSWSGTSIFDIAALAPCPGLNWF